MQENKSGCFFLNKVYIYTMLMHVVSDLEFRNNADMLIYQYWIQICTKMQHRQTTDNYKKTFSQKM